MKKIIANLALILLSLVFIFTSSSLANPPIKKINSSKGSVAAVTCPKEKFTTIAFSVPAKWKGRNVRINRAVPKHIKRFSRYGVRFYEIRVAKRKLGSKVRTLVTFRLNGRNRVHPQRFAISQLAINCKW